MVEVHIPQKKEALTQIRKKQFAQAVASGKNPVDAYKDVWKSKANPNTIATSTSKLLNDPIIRTDIIDLLNKQGLTLEYLNSKLYSLTFENKEVLDSKGNIKSIKDNSINLEAIKLAYKLHNIDNITPTNLTQINVLNQNPARLQAIVDSINKLNKNLGIQSKEMTEGVDIYEDITDVKPE